MKLATGARSFESFEGTGFRFFDYPFYFALKPGSVTSFILDDDWKDIIKADAENAKRLGMTYIQAHLPICNSLADENSNDNYYNYNSYDKFVSGTIRTLEACSILGIENAVWHHGFKFGIEKDEFSEKNKEFLMKILPAAEEFGVNVLVENFYFHRKINGVWTEVRDLYMIRTAEEMLGFIEYVDHPMLHAMWDTGHCNLAGLSNRNEILRLGDELRGLHVNVNSGYYDDHLPPLFSQNARISIDDIMSALLEIKYPGYFTFETSPASIEQCFPPEKDLLANASLATAARGLETKRNSLLYDTGKYILTAYGCFEE